MAVPWYRQLLRSQSVNFLMEVTLRVVLFLLFILSEYVEPIMIVIQPEELWHYRYPELQSQVPIEVVFGSIIVFAPIVFLVFGSRRQYKNVREISQAALAITLGISLTGLITNTLKVLVGRPRPCFLERCYGHEYLRIEDVSKPCTVMGDWVQDRRKSFPSGHASLAFSAFGMMSLYVAGKLGTFNRKVQTTGWQLVVTLIPLIFASWIAISRYSDYHHHSSDIFIGSLIGLAVGYMSYRIYYPSLIHPYSHYPWAWLNSGVVEYERSMANELLLPQETTTAGRSELFCSTHSSFNLQARSTHSSGYNVDIYVSRNRNHQLENSHGEVSRPSELAYYLQGEVPGQSTQSPGMLNELAQIVLQAIGESGRKNMNV
ncbi:Phosphatidate phosphatase PPAPDC1A [Orchesella cincta]|uniref:Phosphatidate phosphatase PPAPDC1A n=1 Tax=Orchesella cincta TaxID=48709 RepID=A0A1D2N092_ORCCI|nr:Phosphatidate phosphatase PPAPDC1A [Orchesella cincta]